MARVVIAWEFGGGLGHILYDLPLAKRLQKRGHEVICIMKNVIDAEKILGQYGIKVMQAPVWQVKVKPLENTFSYAETLFVQGYLVKGALLSMTKAWRGLLDLIKPDLLIVDHAPTALIAARGTGIKVMLYGTGFFAPPVQIPIPSIIPWVKAPEGFIEFSEKKATKTINAVLKEIKAPLLKNLSDLFVVDENILATYKELDHYQNRENANYWGPVISLPEGEAPEWPGQPDQKRIFCYLKPSYPHFEDVMTALSQADAACIIFAPKLPPESKKKYQSSALVFSDKPLDMKQVCKECDLVVCHAGHGTMAVTLLHGKPLMLIPEHNQLEQVIIARNVVLQKLGQLIFTRQPIRDYKGKLMKLLTEEESSIQAQKFAEKYKTFDPEEQIKKIVDRCEEIIENP
jgi:UDP:flavonoid glycosyltransferase YjiC (YdhE family)